ncbi:fatty acid desaturase [Phyllobacterium lublinensis]|uniref:fatty acid desaturase n=1 Tax=Phyllobacterium lublinensis TaxID=2875708 RepID=UPI001CCE958A|nr:fatty acid desaturase [Phyllobacterium sp. 2063]MBZ9655752.1 fatty acid desaturase [Phyllobacterium sp. 2063]
MGEAYRSYALTGDASGASDITGDAFEDKVEAEWFSAKVDRKAFKQLIKRSDAAGLQHFGVWLGLLLGSGTLAFLTWGTWWCVPAFLVYGMVYSMSDHHAHELSHGTPFKTRWINEIFYHLNGFMTLHEGHYWRWSHSRHHTETLIVGRDPEIAVPRPPDIAGMLLDLFFIKSGLKQIGSIIRQASGSLNEEGRHFIPEGEKRKVFWSSRVFVAIFAGVVLACVATGSILPAMFIILPRFYGGFMAQLFNLTQHAGMQEDIRDHRLSTRTWHTNPVFRFMYMNMNYHIEHHMFPMVPFYNLPKLHEMIRAECPPPYEGLGACYAEIIPAVLKQVKDPSWYVRRPLPVTLVAAE